MFSEQIFVLFSSCSHQERDFMEIICDRHWQVSELAQQIETFHRNEGNHHFELMDISQLKKDAEHR